MTKYGPVGLTYYLSTPNPFWHIEHARTMPVQNISPNILGKFWKFNIIICKGMYWYCPIKYLSTATFAWYIIYPIHFLYWTSQELMTHSVKSLRVYTSLLSMDVQSNQESTMDAVDWSLCFYLMVLLLFASYWSLLNFRMSIVAFPLELTTFYHF